MTDIPAPPLIEPPDAGAIVSPWRGQWLGFITLGMIVLFTLLPRSYTAMMEWPWVVVWQAGFLCSNLWLIWQLRQFAMPFRPLGYGLDWCVLVLGVGAILSSWGAVSPPLAAWTVAQALNFLLLAYGLRNWLGQGWLTLERFWLALTLLGTGTSVVSLAWWVPTNLASPLQNYFPFSHHNFVAGFCCLILPPTFAYAWAHQGWRRILGLVGSVSLVLDLYSTSSRGGMLGLLAVTGVGAGMAIWQSRGIGRRWIVGVSSLFLVALLVVALNNPRVKSVLKIGDREQGAIPVAVTIDGPAQDRMFMLKTLTNILKDRPLLGVGPGNMARTYNLYRPIEQGSFGFDIQQLHNSPAQFLGELGLTGFLSIMTAALLWVRLWYKSILTHQDRPSHLFLLYGIGGGLFAYAISSLTDFQLENIGLSFVLLSLVCLGLYCADQADWSPAFLTTRKRRIFSLAVIGFTAFICVSTVPLALAIAIHTQANQMLNTKQLERAIDKLELAKSLAPWDPVYPLSLGFLVLRFRDKTPGLDVDTQALLTKKASSYFKEAVRVAPHDEVFRNNYAVLIRESNAQEALVNARLSIESVPRVSGLLVYYVLGEAYLRQGERQKAITAFALQTLINPNFLLTSVWYDQEDLRELRDPVRDEAFRLWEQLESQLQENDPNKSLIPSFTVPLRWWDNLPQKDVDFTKLSPINQVLWLSDRDPKRAFELVQDLQKKNPDESSFNILRAWLDPTQSLAAKISVKREGDSERKIYLLRGPHRLTQGNFQRLAAKLPQDDYLFDAERKALFYTYRNTGITFGNQNILWPQEIKLYEVIQWLNLFGSSYPRSWPALENFLEDVREKELGIIHPTRNGFKLD